MPCNPTLYAGENCFTNVQRILGAMNSCFNFYIHEIKSFIPIYCRLIFHWCLNLSFIVTPILVGEEIWDLLFICS